MRNTLVTTGLAEQIMPYLLRSTLQEQLRCDCNIIYAYVYIYMCIYIYIYVSLLA